MLRGRCHLSRPVIVGGGGPSDRGVVSAASYEARRFGVRSAMPLRTAGALCPEGVFLPVDGRRYSGVSRQVMAILRRFTPAVEQVSIDEAFLDLSGTDLLLGSGEQVARRIKAAIREELALTASVGIAINRLVAKVASDLRKPDGLVVVAPGTEASFLAPLPIERLWGVGQATRRRLAEYGVTTIGDLAELPDELLRRRFGAHGPELAARARGIDVSPVGRDAAARSISQEHTFEVDTADWAVIEGTLLALSEGVGGRLRADGLWAATVGVKIRDSAFNTMTRQRTLAVPTNVTEVLWLTSLELVRREVHGMKLRLVGVGAYNLSARQQLALFDDPNPRRRRAMEAADLVRQRYGPRALRRARLIEADVPGPFERDHLRAPETEG
ncbi:MAG TPA: DNA polymerase IV [Candidatus Limnocylindrales bacterium]|nr:DNA polymerase IV [Candidatus Limnocylindrales bacterium]